MYSRLAPGRASASILSLQGRWPSALTLSLPVQGARLHRITDGSASGKTGTAMLAKGRTGLSVRHEKERESIPLRVKAPQDANCKLQAASGVITTCYVLLML